MVSGDSISLRAMSLACMDTSCGDTSPMAHRLNCAPPTMPRPMMAGGVKNVSCAEGMEAPMPCSFRCRLPMDKSLLLRLSQCSSCMKPMPVFSAMPDSIEKPETQKTDLMPGMPLTLLRKSRRTLPVRAWEAPMGNSMFMMMTPLSSSGRNEEAVLWLNQ